MILEDKMRKNNNYVELMSELKFPREFRREVRILESLGVAPYDINYILHLRRKEKLRERWD